MTTALDIITDALFEIGAAEAGQSVPAEDAALALRYLNRILQRWANMRLLIPALTTINVPLTGAASYTIGPSGADVTAARPVKLNSAFAVDSAGQTSHVRVYSRAEFDAITDKTVTGGPPVGVYWRTSPTGTTGTLYVYPTSDGYTLTLVCQTLLTSFANVAASVVLPEGYESALVLTLADDLAAPFQVPIRPDVQRRAAAATRAIKRSNYEPLLVNVGEDADYEIERGY